METPVQDVAMDEPIDLRDPYPMFARRRLEGGVFRGSVMDWSQDAGIAATREPLRRGVVRRRQPGVPRRQGVQLAASTTPPSACSSVPTILAMEGKPHWEHRNLVSAAFKSRSLARWEPEIVRPVVNGLIDEFIETGDADLVRDFTFEFPTRVISKLLGLPEDDLAWFRKRAVELISYTIKYKRAFEASAALKDYFLEQIEKRRSAPTEDIIGDLVSAEIDGEKLSDEAIYSFLRLLLPAGLETTYRSSGNLLYLLLTHRDQFDAVLRRSRADRLRHRGGPALRDAADHRAALRHRGHRGGGRADPGGLGDRRVHRFGQPGRAALGTPRGVRHLPEEAAAHLLRRGRAHLHGTAPGADGDPGGRRMPTGPGCRTSS